MARDRVAGFMFFPDAWAGDTIHLSLSEEGAFIRLVAQLARHDGYLPDRADYVCRVLRISPIRWDKLRATLIGDRDRRVLHVTDDGRIYSKRLLEELAIARAAREQRRAAASARWSSRARVNDEVERKTIPNENENESSRTYSRDENSTPTLGRDDAPALRADMRPQCNKSRLSTSPQDTSYPSETRDDVDATPKKKRPSGKTSVEKRTWVTPYCEAFVERFKGEAPCGLILKTISPVRVALTTERGRRGGELETMMRWKNYLAEQRPGLYNLHHFTQAHGKYATPTTDASESGDRGNGLDVEAQVAWRRVRAQLGSVGRFGEPKLTDLESSALNAIGGWDGLCRSLEKDLPYLQQRFVKAYKGQQR